MHIKERTAPLQEHVIETMRELMAGRHEETPEDGYDRVDYRMELVLDGLYDGRDPEDETQPLIDLLTDVLHTARAKGVDIFDLLERAQWMQRQEIEEWDER
jgi:hypothetical protein